MAKPLLALRNLRDNEPVRLYVYPGLVMVVGYLAVSGYIDNELGNMILAVVGLVLGIPMAEAARNRVRPEAKVQDVINAAVDTAITEAKPLVEEKLGEQGVAVLDQVQGYIGRHRKPE